MNAKKMMTYLAVFLLCGFVSTANATITWNYDATFAARTDDPLQIDGESFLMTMTFNEAETWENTGDGSNLYLHASSSSLSIAGGHTASLSSMPVLRFNSTDNDPRISIVGLDDRHSYIDFIIDEKTAVSFLFNFADGPSSNTYPSEGVQLFPELLSTTLNPKIATVYGYDESYAWDEQPNTLYYYDHTHPSSVPEPSTWILLGTGLAGLAYYRRKKS